MPARPGKAVEHALDDVEYDVEAAARTSLDADKLARKWPVQIVVGKVSVNDAA